MTRPDIISEGAGEGEGAALSKELRRTALIRVYDTFPGVIHNETLVVAFVCLGKFSQGTDLGHVGKR
jgi:hypothetical protein